MSQRTHYEVKRMSSESGPLSSWVDSMALETRQFMALNAMNEALFIARNLTMDFFFCPAIKMDVNGEQARTAALSVFAPLFDEVDTQMERTQVHKKNIGKVDIPDVPLFRENTDQEDGLVGWLRTYESIRRLFGTTYIRTGGSTPKTRGGPR